MTTATTVNLKTPYVALQRLRLQDVAGLKLTSLEYNSISLIPPAEGNKDSSVRERRSQSLSTKRSDSNVKEGRWLKEQAETTHGENTALEDRATKDGERCLPAGEEGSKEHHCFRCNLNFPNSDTLVLHLKSHGPVRRSCTLYEKEVYGTSVEGSGPQNRRTLASTSKQGESSSCSDESRFPCNLCNKVFMQSNHLKLHMRSHSDGKTDKERGTDSDENSPPLDTTAFIKMMKNVIEESAIKCFTDALETNNLPPSSDEALDLVRTRARKALEQYCSNSEGLMDLKQREDDLERILQNLDDDSLDIKQEDDDDDYNDGNGGGSDKGVVSVNSHNGSFNCQNSLPNHQANFKSHLENENSAEVPECSSASDKHTENVGAPSVTDSVICSVQNIVESKKITAVTTKAQENKGFTENVLGNKLCTPHKSSVPDTQKHVTTKVSPSKKHSPVGSTPPKEPGQSDTDAVKTSGGENTALTTYQQLMLRKSKKLFSCQTCHKVFTLQSHLKLHRRNVHGMKQSKPNIDIRFSENTDPKEGKKDKDIAKIKQPVYQCNIKSCSKLFSQEQDFKLHLNTHQHEKYFNCSMCDKVFPEEYLLKRHEKLHSGLMYNCTMCDKAYEMNEDLLLHMSREHPANKHSPENSNKMIEETISPHSYQCLKCNIQFSDNDTYELHLKSDHIQVPNLSIHTTPVSMSGSRTGLSLHVCFNCNMQFPNGTVLEHHLNTCNSPVLEKKKALDCSNCSMKFPDDISLENHMKLTHTKMLLICPQCNLKFPNGSALQSHMKHHVTRSPIGTPSKCSKCQLKFSSDASLERHMKLQHSMFQSSNQHTCSKCGMKFNNQALLARHKTLTHSPKFEESKKVLTCSTCGMKYSDGSSFHSHMKHHTSVVQKSTELCDATVSEDVVIKLSDPDSRAKLQNISTPVDNTGTGVQCSQCDLRFSDRNELQSHMKLNHASKIGYHYSEMNHNQHVSAKNLHPSPKGQTKQDIESDQTPVSEKSQLSQADFECSKCNFQFSDFDSLQTHMKLNHTPSLQNPDMKVTKTLVSESKHTSVQNSVSSKYNGLSSKPTSTETYSRTKRTEIVFECPKCLLILKSNQSLQNHIKMQHSTTPEKANVLKCLRCQKQFHTSTQYRCHLRTHRRRLCPQCGKSFTTQNGLLKHMSSHVSQLSYKCDTCSCQFSSSVFFKKHLEWHDEDRGNIEEHTKTGNVSQSVAAAPGSSPTIDSVIGDIETTSHGHLVEEDLVTIDDDDDVIILSDDEDNVNKESHNSDEVEVNEIMMVLDNSSPHLFEDSSDKQLRNRTPEKSIGVQTEVLDNIEGHGSVDPSGNMVGAKIFNKSTVSSRKLSSSDGMRKSLDSSSPVSSFNESASDSQDTVQLENYEIVRKSPKTSPLSLNRKRILKDTNQLVAARQKKRKMLRVSFANDVSDGGSDSSISSENVERTMPKLLPENMTVDTNKALASQNNVKRPSLFKNCSVSLTTMEDSTLGGNAIEISTAGNKAASELLQRGEFSTNRIYGGKKINDEESREFLPLSAEAKNTNTSKESNKPSARTLLHYFHFKNAVNSPFENDSRMMNKSSPVATSTPLTNNKINPIRTADSAVHSPEAEKVPEKGGELARDLRPHYKLSLSNNITSHHSENRNKTSEYIERQKSEPTYTRKKKLSQLKAGRFKCKTCGKVFQSLPHFRVHKKTHAGQLIHKCPICNDRFPLRFLLGLHVADHFQKGIPQMIRESEMPCSTSKNIAPIFHIPKKKSTSMTRDSNDSTAADTFLSGAFSHCSDASTTTIDGSAKQINSLVQNQLLPFETNKDHSSGLQLLDNSNESIGNYSSDKQFQCGDSFGYSPSKEKNEGVEFACEKCNVKFTTFLKLKLHESVHTGIGLYKCLYCDLMFHFKTSLVSHVETHSGEKKFVCKYCGRQFEEYSVMVKHRSHHEDGKRPFKCPDCPRTFVLDSTLRAHMQIHIRGALYRCTFCNCSFTVKANFQNHIIVHTGKKPFFCKVCNFAFNRLAACHKHVNQVHIAKNEITIKSGQTFKDFVQVDEGLYNELQDYVRNIISKTRLGSEGKSEHKSADVSVVAIDKEAPEPTIDKELPEPILVVPKRLQDSFRKEICKAKANCTLSDIYSADMNKKERHEKLSIEVKNVLMRMKRFPQIPLMSPSRNQSPLKTPTRQIRDPRLRKSLHLSESRSPNNLADTSTDRQDTSRNLTGSSDQTHNPRSSSQYILDKKHKKTVQVYKDVIAASKGEPCKYCGEVFSVRYMKTHELTHTGRAEHLCSFCDKGFTTKTGLRYHLALHADVRPYPCAVCGQAFKLKHQMLSHVRKHTSRKNHKCKVCSKAFFSKGNLKAHILTHVPKEDRPFKCDQCDQRFPTKHRLSYHAQRHSKVRPYECHICYRKFSDKFSAQRHAKKIHIGRNHLFEGIAQSDAPIV